MRSIPAVRAALLMLPPHDSSSAPRYARSNVSTAESLAILNGMRMSTACEASDGLDAADLRLVGLAVWRTTVRST